MPRKSASKKQRGGSLASNRVMENLDTVAATHDYVVSPRIRTKSRFGNTNTYQLTGGACGACGGHKHAEGFRGCGATAPTQSGGGGHKKEEFGSCGGSTTPTQSGGTRRRSNKSGKSSGKNRKSLRKSSGKNRKSLRKSSGKNRKSLRKSSGKNRKSLRKSSGKNRKTRKQRGGGSAWLSSHNSGSLSNLTHARSGHFTKHPITSRGIYLNPPNMGLAGSELGGTYDRYAPAN
tara:strand:- start:3 stop:701 length:699 start_codon:yes stop_codon:yes gene_type:complete